MASDGLTPPSAHGAKAIEEALSNLECAATAAWCFTRAAMTETHGLCECRPCEAWRLLQAEQDAHEEKDD